MRKIIAVVFVFYMAFTLVACDNVANNSTISPSVLVNNTVQPSDISVPPSGLPVQTATISNETEANNTALFKSILLDDAPFFDTDKTENLSLEQYFEAYYNEAQRWDLLMEIREFALIDLDMDGADEAVLVVYVEGGLYPEWYLILHHENETVYGITITYRGFRDLKQDGTFTFSSGADNNGIGKLMFNTDSYEINSTTYKSSSDSGGNYTVTYIVNNSISTEQEYETAWTDQEKKHDAAFREFSEDEIKRSFE